MRLQEARLKGSLNLLSTFRAEMIDGYWRLSFSDKSVGLVNDFYPVELQRGEIKNYKSVTTVFNDLSHIVLLNTIPVFIDI